MPFIQDPPSFNGKDLAILLKQDLGGSQEPELVVEFPGSCGTGGCEGAVLTPCSGGYVPLGEVFLWGNVEAKEPRVNGWLTVTSTGPINAFTNEPSLYRYAFDGSVCADARTQTASAKEGSQP